MSVSEILKVNITHPFPLKAS